MDPGTGAQFWTTMALGLITLLGLTLPFIYNKRDKAKNGDEQDPHFVNVGATLIAMSKTISEQSVRISRLEQRGLAERQRISQLEFWGRYSTDPPPRDPPPWIPPGDSDGSE